MRWVRLQGRVEQRGISFFVMLLVGPPGHFLRERRVFRRRGRVQAAGSWLSRCESLVRYEGWMEVSQGGKVCGTAKGVFDIGNITSSTHILPGKILQHPVAGFRVTCESRWGNRIRGWNRLTRKTHLFRGTPRSRNILKTEVIVISPPSHRSVRLVFRGTIPLKLKNLSSSNSCRERILTGTEDSWVCSKVCVLFSST